MVLGMMISNIIYITMHFTTLESPDSVFIFVFMVTVHAANVMVTWTLVCKQLIILILMT
jgi:hypothetical protein